MCQYKTNFTQVCNVYGKPFLLLFLLFYFYSFTGYEFLISTIQFLLVKMLILHIRNWISTSKNVNS